jgi:hypothetical protein
MKPRLGPAAVKLIEGAVEKLFEKIRNHTLGDKHPTGMRLYIAYRTDLTLKGIFDLAAAEEGVQPDQDVLKTLLKISNSYLDATKERAKAKVVQSVQAFLTDAGNKGVKTNIETVLGGKLYEVMGEATRDLKRIFETESTVVRNTSIMDGIVRSNAAAGIDDPTVVFIVVRDGQTCAECKRLHVLSDGITPRAWKLSQVGSGYHKKGDTSPKVGGLHPHCRCVLTTILPGYGFNAAGRVQYKSPGWDEYEHQQHGR